MRDYKKINAWKCADDLTVMVYEATRGFPSEERFGLTSQLRRASYSVPSNIAEGASRVSKKDYLHFLYIARGSAAEVEYFVHLSGRLAFLDDESVQELGREISKTQSCLFGLIKAVEREAGPVRKIIARTTSFLILSVLGILSAKS